jgi:hypothetical protein
MNALDLPPRRPLPRETRDRIRRSVGTGIAVAPRRTRIPLAAAAAVVLLAAGAVMVANWAPSGDRDEWPPAAGDSVTMALPDARTDEDLDRCADVATASPRADEFAPRSEWSPRFTATAPDGARITAFVGKNRAAAFCEVTTTTATVSDPTGGWVVLADTPTGMRPASAHAVYLSTTGVLAGTTDVEALEFSLVRGTKIVPAGVPALRDGMFVVDLGEFDAGDSLSVIGRDSLGLSVVSGMLALTPQSLPAPGVTGPIG